MSAQCGACGQSTRYKLAPRDDQAWEAFLLAWRAQYQAMPVSIAALFDLATEQGVKIDSRLQLGHLLGASAKARTGPHRYRAGKGKRQPALWVLEQ